MEAFPFSKVGANLSKVATDDGPKLHLAAATRNLGGCMRLLEAGVPVDCPGGRGVKEPALVAAAREGHLDAVRLLLDYNASVEAANVFGNTPLMCAAIHGRTDVVSLLLANGAADVTTGQSGVTALFSAAHNGHAACAQVLMATLPRRDPV